MDDILSGMKSVILDSPRGDNVCFTPITIINVILVSTDVLTPKEYKIENLFQILLIKEKL